MRMHINKTWEECLARESDIRFDGVDTHFFYFSLAVDEDLDVGVEIAIDPGIVRFDDETLKINHVVDIF